MKKKLCMACFLILIEAMCSACGRQAQSLAESNGVSEHGQLLVEEGKLKDKNGDIFQLRGLSTHGISWFPQYINAGAFASVKERGGNVVRIAMYTDTKDGYLAKPEENMTLMLQAIENARSQDLYVIVDWHILSDGDPNTNLDRAITFFDAIASKYANDPAVIYEICNEPNDVTWDAIQQYGYAIFPVIRQYSPDAVIILGTPMYSGDLNEPLLRPFPEENFLYAFHYYAGQHENYDVLRYAVEHDFPVMVSEWGINYDKSQLPALEDGELFVSYLNENEISWCAWSLCNKDEVFSVLKTDCEVLSNWEETDLTDVGQVVFEALDGGVK